jgi:hypothetical protein
MATPAQPVSLMAGPGISKKDTDLALSDRWIDCDKVLFIDGKPQKMGGWEEFGIDSVGDAIRGILAWSTTELVPFIGFGTHRKLYAVDQGLGDPYDITPIEATGSLTDPFATTDGSAIVVVTDASNGRVVGDEVIFDDATAVGGITIDGSYVIQEIVDQDTYTIEHTAPATSTVASGGGTVSFEYLLGISGEDPVLGDGYGAGGYGLFDYGEPTEDPDGGFIFDPRVWSLDQYGDFMVANPVNKGVYFFDPTDTPAYQRAAAISGAPTECRSVFVTPERFIFALGVDGDPMNIKWPDRDDPTDWTPTDVNTSNERRLREGTRIIAGRGLANLLSLVWTDTAVYRFQYTGRAFVYDSELIGTNCGLTSPLAMVVHQGVAYWLSFNDFLMSSGNAPVPIPNSTDVREFVLTNMRRLGYEFKANAHLNTRHNYIFWFYVPEGSSEPGLYVAVSLVDFSWVVGELERTSGTYLKGPDQRPILADSTGTIYQHEEGVDADGETMESFITRAPIQMRNGAQLGEISALIPDTQRQVGNMTVEIETYDRLRDGVLDELVEAFDEEESIVDLRIGGRLAKVTLRSNVLGGDFRLGAPMLEVKATGSRR